MRRISILVTSLALVLSGLVFSPVSAAVVENVNCVTDGSVTGSGTFTIEDNIVVSGRGCKGKAVIPDGVESIAGFAFSSASGLTSVTIPSSVKNIGSYAFDWAQSLEAVEFMPGSSDPLDIGESAFRGTGITSIEIPANVTFIGIGSFAYMYSLASVTFATPRTSPLIIGDYAFLGASSLSSIEIPAMVTSIGRGAFGESESLYSVKFSTSGDLLTIGESAFAWTPLNSIVIPASVMSIGNSAFMGTAITKVTFASPRTSPLTIGDSAFSNLPNLRRIQIPASVTSIGKGAFRDSYLLASVTFASPSTLQSIGDFAFRNTSLEIIEIPATVETIGDGVFYDTFAMAEFTVAGDSTYFKAVDDVLFTYDSLTLVAYPAAKSVQTYEIPGDTEVIKVGAFHRAQNLESFTVNANNLDFKAVNGVLFTFNSLTLLAYPAAKSATTYEVPASTTTIEDYAFVYANGLSSVTFPTLSDLLTIGDYAFYGTSFVTIQIPAKVTSIGQGAFADLGNLKSVTFAASSAALTIGTDAFSWGSLNSITIPARVTSIGENAFSGTKLVTVPFAPNSTLQIIEDYAFSNVLKLVSVQIPKSVKSIGQGAFDYSTALASVTFEPTSTLETIGNFAFARTAISSITIPAGLTSIGEYALARANKLNTISFLGDIPDNGDLDSPGDVISLEPLDRTGYTFNGWYSDASFTTVIPDHPNYGIPRYAVDGPATLYSKFNNRKASATVKPTISGKATSTKNGTNKLTAKQGTWEGYPAPTVTLQWYVCTKQVTAVTQTIPKTCKAISKQTKTTIAVTAAHKGKFLAVAAKGTSKGTSATTWLSKSTAKVK
jgi:uncharacterized repeat protein (TIGR02543 family)